MFRIFLRNAYAQLFVRPKLVFLMIFLKFCSILVSNQSLQRLCVIFLQRINHIRKPGSNSLFCFRRNVLRVPGSYFCIACIVPDAKDRLSRCHDYFPLALLHKSESCADTNTQDQEKN